MKELLILRHGKSDWDASYGADHDRPLATRGRRAASLIGQFVRGAERLPDRVVTSTAVRARDTVEIAAEAGAWDCPIVQSKQLYEAGVREVLRQIHGLDSGDERVLLAGHQPTSAAVVHHLTDAHVAFPTAALACIAVSVERWSEVDRGCGELLWLVTPRILAGLL